MPIASSSTTFICSFARSINQSINQSNQSNQTNNRSSINQPVSQTVSQSVQCINLSIHLTPAHTHTYTLSADVPVKCKAYRSKTSRHVKTSRGFISHATAKFQMVFIYIALVTGILNTHLRREDQTQGLLSCIHTWSPGQVTTCCFPLRPASHLVVLPWYWSYVQTSKCFPSYCCDTILRFYNHSLQSSCSSTARAYTMLGHQKGQRWYYHQCTLALIKLSVFYSSSDRSGP